MREHRLVVSPPAPQNPKLGGATYPLAHRLLRLVWQITWLMLAAWTPPQMRGWRRTLLRLFGANIHPTATVYASCRIWYPKNLSMAAYSTLGRGVNCYSMASVSLAEHAVVSQRAHLCTGSHDISSADFSLVTAPIHIGAWAWICAEAFVGPGVTVEEGAVLAARGVAFRDLEGWTVHRGNPALAVKTRKPFGEDTQCRTA